MNLLFIHLLSFTNVLRICLNEIFVRLKIFVNTLNVIFSDKIASKQQFTTKIKPNKRSHFITLTIVNLSVQNDNQVLRPVLCMQ